MKLRLSLLAVLTLALTLLPPNIHSAEGPPVGERTLVISGQGYFPVALRLQDGRIAVVLRGGAPHLGIAGRLDMVFSSDEGKTWTAPTVVVDSPLDDRNPSLGQAADGAIVLGFWRTATYDDTGKYAPKLDKPRNTWVTRSADAGKTWSDPAQIDVSDIGYGSPFGRITTLPDGTMIQAIYGEPERPKGEKLPSDRSHSYLYRSQDHGKTWRRDAEIGDGKLQFNETSLLRLASGKFLAALRSRAGEVCLATSDDAHSWTLPKTLTPIGFQPGDLCALPDGRVLLTIGDRAEVPGVVGVIGAADGQFDWEKRFTIVNDAASKDCGYPSSVVLKDGRILTVYYATRAKGHPEWGVHCSAVIYSIQ